MVLYVQFRTFIPSLHDAASVHQLLISLIVLVLSFYVCFFGKVFPLLGFQIQISKAITLHTVDCVWILSPQIPFTKSARFKIAILILVGKHASAVNCISASFFKFDMKGYGYRLYCTVLQLSRRPMSFRW